MSKPPSKSAESTEAGQDAVNAISSLSAGNGKVAEHLRRIDWAKHPLGTPDTWPQSLRTMVKVMLASRFQMWLGWGEELFFFYNDAYAPTLGMKEPRAFATAFKQLWPEIWDSLKPRIDAVIRTGQATWDEGLLLLLERNGYAEETYHTFSYSPVPDDAGGVGGLLCTVTEVTESVIGERRMGFLRDLASTLANIKTEREIFDAVEKCSIGRTQDVPFALLYLFDGDEREARLAKALGVEKDSALAPAVISLSAESPSIWPAAAVLASGGAATVPRLSERFASLPRGPWDSPPREAAVVPFAQQGQTHPAGFIVVGLNPYRPFDAGYRGFLELLAGQIAAGISNARAYEAERKRSEALAEIDRAKTTFFSNVSHELRTPLTLMLGPLEDLASLPEGTSGSEARELAVLAQRNGLRLLKLVNTLLDFSRIEAGRMQASFAPTDLSLFTADLASTFRSAIEKAGIKLIVDTPPLSEAIYVDRLLWEKILLNLLSNAFKFTHAGEIRVSLKEESEYVCIEVTDTGTGIPEEAKSRIFERFYRVEGARGRTQEGTGIGLALVADLVRLHGGIVEVRSTLGKGSTFAVKLRRGSGHLPREQVVMPSSLAVTPEAQNPRLFLEEALRWDSSAPASPLDGQSLPLIAKAPTAAVARAKILLVDDNADMREYVGRILSTRFLVRAVADGEEALAVLRTERPDLVLSDVMMPRLDGFGLVKAIRGNAVWRTLPVILLSARAGEEARVEGIDEGADDYLVKPFSARELVARVTTHLELVRVRKEAQQQVQKSEESFRLAVEAGEVGTWAWEIRSNKIELSELACKIIGTARDHEDYELAQFLAFILPDDRASAEEDMLRAAREGSRFRREVQIGRRDGGVVWVSIQGQVFFDEADGKPARMLGALVDITEDRMRDQELRQTQARLDATLDAAAIGTWTWNISQNTLLGDYHFFRLFSMRETGRETVAMEKLSSAIHPSDLPRVRNAFAAAARGRVEAVDEDYRVLQSDGTYRWVSSRGKLRHDPDEPDSVMSGVLIDITARKKAEEERAALLVQEQQAREEAEALGATARALTEDLDLHATVQKATDVATKLTGAKFGAFFYNLVNERQEAYVLYTLSGAPREAFERFGLPRNTQIFAPTFAGEGVVRLDDVHADPRYGKNSPHHGMPKGHLPVRSYLAVPVASRSGEVIGGMFFGHPDPGIFTARAERLAVAIAAQASVAIDNAKLYKRVQSSVERLHFSLSSLQLGDWNWDLVSDVMSISERTAEIFGLPPQGKTTREEMRAAIHPEDREFARTAALRAVETGTDYDVEYRVIHAIKGLRWVSAKGRPLFDADKKVTGMMGVVQDITERKQAELHLRSQKEVLQQIVVGTPLPEILEGLTDWIERFAGRKLVATILLVSPDGQHLYMAAGKNCPREWANFLDGIRTTPTDDSYRSASFFLEPLVIRDISVDLRWQMFRAVTLPRGLHAFWSSPIKSSTGGILGTVAIYFPETTTPTAHELQIVDVVTRTAAIAIERKQSEDALKDSQARLKEHADLLEKTVADRTVRLRETIGELEAFSYSVSHDMRAPLRSMQGYSQILLKDYADKLDEDAANYLTRISKNAERLELLVRDVLAYSKVSKQDIDLRPVDLDTFVPPLIHQLLELQRGKVNVVLARPLPTVLAHEAYLSQIFTNLVSNSIKFSQSDAVPKIEIAAQPDGQFVKISVKDNGIGIAPEHFNRIFEIFGRVYPDKRFEGTGIGLSIVKKAVTRMGGTIGVDSSLGSGSCFWFTLRSL